MKTTIILISVLCLFSCKKDDNNFIAARKFLTSIKTNGYATAKGMFSKSVYNSSYDGIVNSYIMKTSRYISIYDVPPENKWLSEINSRNYETIIVPLEGDGINHKYENIKFIFDCSGADDGIIYYDVYERPK